MDSHNILSLLGLSLRGGRLAARLTGYKIDIKPESYRDPEPEAETPDAPEDLEPEAEA